MTLLTPALTQTSYQSHSSEVIQDNKNTNYTTIGNIDRINNSNNESNQKTQPLRPHAHSYPRLPPKDPARRKKRDIRPTQGINAANQQALSFPPNLQEWVDSLQMGPTKQNSKYNDYHEAITTERGEHDVMNQDLKALAERIDRLLPPRLLSTEHGIRGNNRAKE